MLSLLALPLHAQSLLSSLSEHQNTLTKKSTVTNIGGSSTATTTLNPSKSAGICSEDEQTSLPLAYVTSLIQEKNAALDIVHDPRAGTLTVSASDMISNCSSMVQWEMKK